MKHLHNLLPAAIAIAAGLTTLSFGRYPSSGGDGTTTRQSLIKAWRAILGGEGSSWVLFEHGTCVILMKPEKDLARQAMALIKEWGPVEVGSPAGDFSVSDLSRYPGYAVTCHHPDILTYVAPDEAGAGAATLRIGLLGRTKRGEDADHPVIIHIEDKRGHP